MVGALCDVLGVEVAFHDPGVEVFGLENAVMPIGDTFLEVVSPRQPGTTAGRYLERRGGDGGYMVIVQTDDLDADSTSASRARRAHRVERRARGHPGHAPASRATSAARSCRSTSWSPRSWRWAGPRWARRAHRRDVRDRWRRDPDGRSGPLAKRWGEVLGRGVSAGRRGGGRAVERGSIRFVKDGRPRRRRLGLASRRVIRSARVPALAPVARCARTAPSRSAAFASRSPSVGGTGARRRPAPARAARASSPGGRAGRPRATPPASRRRCRAP